MNACVQQQCAYAPASRRPARINTSAAPTLPQPSDDLEQALMPGAQSFGGWAPPSPSSHAAAPPSPPSPGGEFLLALSDSQSVVRRQHMGSKRRSLSFNAGVEPMESRPLTPLPRGAPWCVGLLCA
jgi:hypothetical protein